MTTGPTTVGAALAEASAGAGPIARRLRARVARAPHRSDHVIGEDPLSAYGPHAADLIRRIDGFAHCPDALINSRYDPGTDDASPFEVNVGSHGGLGGAQSPGFLVHPVDLPAPGEIVGAEVLHRVLRGWLSHLGHPEPPAAAPAEPPGRGRGPHEPVDQIPARFE